MDSLAYAIRLGRGGAATVWSTPRLLWQAYCDADAVRELRASVHAARPQLRPRASMEGMKHVAGCYGGLWGELPVLVGKMSPKVGYRLLEEQRELSRRLEEAERNRRSELEGVELKIREVENQLEGSQPVTPQQKVQWKIALAGLKRRRVQLEELESRRPIPHAKKELINLNKTLIGRMFRKLFAGDLEESLLIPLARYKNCEMALLLFIEYCLGLNLKLEQFNFALIRKLLLDFAREIREYEGKHGTLPERGECKPERVSPLKHWLERCDPNLEASITPDFKSQFTGRNPFQAPGAPRWYHEAYRRHMEKFGKRRAGRLVHLAAFRMHVRACAEVDHYVHLCPRTVLDSTPFKLQVTSRLDRLRARFDRAVNWPEA